MFLLIFFFFFQAEDGIRDYKVTGVQTCALPISSPGGSWSSPSGGTRAGPARFGPARRRSQRRTIPEIPHARPSFKYLGLLSNSILYHTHRCRSILREDGCEVSQGRGSSGV